MQLIAARRAHYRRVAHHRINHTSAARALRRAEVRTCKQGRLKKLGWGVGGGGMSGAIATIADIPPF